MNEVYITSLGVFLPGEPISNEEMESYLGEVNGKKSRVKERILKQNGILSRHYALDRNQQTRYFNSDLAAQAIKAALVNSHLQANEIELLCAATTQGDLAVPGFGSMVHAKTSLPAVEVASFQSVCAAGVMALQDAFHQIKAGSKNNAVCVASEFASRQFKSSRYEAQNTVDLPFEIEFLRWMLSDGAGAMVLQNRKPAQGPSFRIEWIDIRSFAHQFPVCMYAGKNDNRDEEAPTWLDYPNYETASRTQALNLKQDIRLLDQVVKTGVQHYFDLIDKGKIVTNEVDWLCCHYSSAYFKGPIQDLMQKGGADIPEEKWFTNLTTKGNTGSASIYIMLEELFYSGKLKDGERILCMVPESGRFITSFMMLIYEKDTGAVHLPYPMREVAAPALHLENKPLAEWMVRQLTQVWIDFELQLLQVPVIKKIHDAKLTKEDYKLLLLDLRQQVIDGSQWISRAASNISIDLFELRSAFIRHTAAEHRDYQILEKNFVALGYDLDEIYQSPKNIGSMALTSFMFHQASQHNPVHLLGSMFIIEGIGNRLAGYWGEMMKEQLGLSEEQVSFFTYHGVADVNHFKNLEDALNHPKMTQEIGEQIVKTAKATAKLYKMQLEELGNY